MTAADYPMVRSVPSKIADGTNLQQRGTEVLVHFGQPIDVFTTDLEGQWQSLLAMEDAILKKLQASPGFFFGYRDTFLDEDRIEASKVLAIRGTVEGGIRRRATPRGGRHERSRPNRTGLLSTATSPRFDRLHRRTPPHTPCSAA